MEVVAVPVPFDGRIQSLPVNVGQDVVEGDLLAEIRSSDLLSQKEISTAELNRLNNRVSTLESNLIAARLEAARAREAAGAARNAVEEAQKASAAPADALQQGRRRTPDPGALSGGGGLGDGNL